MANPRFWPPEEERAIGLEFYVTASPPVSAGFKISPGDFVVEEISSYPRPVPDGPFTILRVESRDWEQHELSERLAQRLGLPPHSLGWAGTKDRRSISVRLLSYRGSPPEHELHLPGVRIVDAYRARDGLVLGHHYGNAFRIRLASNGSDRILEPLQTALGELREGGGFANLFGPQRFGEVRPITHVVGRWIVKGDLDKAVDTYLLAHPGVPGTVGYDARVSFSEHRDPARALREFPPAFRFERKLLNHLASGHSSERALRALSRELRTLFVHAYQAQIFNRWVSRRFLRGISLLDPRPGDHLLRVARDGTIPGVRSVPVGSDNLAECTEWARGGHARLAGPLLGFETPLNPTDPDPFLAEILKEEDLAPSDFFLPQTPDLASKGSWRPVWIPLPPIGMREAPGELESTDSSPSVWLTFALPKGVYATVLLREILKPGCRSVPEDTVWNVPL